MTKRFISNYHTHNNFCDGKNTIEEVVLTAIDKGFLHLGISSHAHIPNQEDWTINDGKMEAYLHEVNRMKRKYANKINIYTGLEIDYFCQLGWYPSIIPYIEDLDYNIGSVHCFYKGDVWEDYYIDDTRESFEKGVDHIFHGNIQEAVRYYYNCIQTMVTQYHPTIVGHIDLIKKNNKGNYFFNEKDKWYRDLVEGVLSTIKSSSSIIEVNTGGIARFGSDLLYPSISILEEIYRKGMDITVNSDCHHVEDIDCYYEEAYHLLKDIGFDRVLFFTDKGWEAFKL